VDDARVQALFDDCIDAFTSPRDAAAATTGTVPGWGPYASTMERVSPRFRDKTILDFTDNRLLLRSRRRDRRRKVDRLDAIPLPSTHRAPLERQRMITPALARPRPASSSGSSSTPDGQRYAVAREARRSGGKTSRVSMHASRL